MGHPLHHAMHGGTPPARTGLAHAVIAPYDAYFTADGGRVLLSSGGGWPNRSSDSPRWGRIRRMRRTRHG
jgi:hypothetical protein